MFATNLGNVIIVSKLLQAGCNVNLHNYSVSFKIYLILKNE